MGFCTDSLCPDDVDQSGYSFSSLMHSLHVNLIYCEKEITPKSSSDDRTSSPANKIRVSSWRWKLDCYKFSYFRLAMLCLRELLQNWETKFSKLQHRSCMRVGITLSCPSFAVDFCSGCGLCCSFDFGSLMWVWVQTLKSTQEEGVLYQLFGFESFYFLRQIHNGSELA